MSNPPLQTTRKSFKGLTFRQRTYVVAVILLIPALALRIFTAFYPFIQDRKSTRLNSSHT